MFKTKSTLSKEIFKRESGLVAPLTFCRRQAAHRARNLCLSRLRTIGIIKEIGDAPDSANPSRVVHRSGITAIDIDSQDWRYVLAGAADGSLYIHDLANYSGIPRHNSNLITEIKCNDGHRSSQERNRFQISQSRSNLRGISNTTPHCNESKGHFKMVTTVQWFPEDSGMFITSGMDGSVKMWDANALEKGPVEEFNFPEQKIFSHHLNVADNKFSSKRSPLTLVAVASASNHINLLDLKSGSASHELR